ncbi:hypothetical protein Bca4012_049711 [Brassica carinata]|uniref:Uncharacterized protein n=1 Tax=Brassica carinata TaxID=52824 RepID=A0A8X7UMC4_BRACI|nr:hypothetical protein Bca52824_052461 [Brassica carinata]
MATTRVDFPALARRYVFSSYVRRVCDTASLDPAWKLRNRHRESSHQPPRSRVVSSSQSGSRLTNAKLNRDQASSTASWLRSPDRLRRALLRLCRPHNQTGLSSSAPKTGEKKDRATIDLSNGVF